MAALTELVSLEHAIAVIVQRCMSENLSHSPIGEDTERDIAAVLTALQAKWPEEYERSSRGVKFVPHPEGGVRAMYRDLAP